jgi:8-oxo-dGTP pyrophosphatase MutT (NUDIX family)
MTILRNQITQLMTNIEPLDALEAEQITDAINWVRMVDEIYRIEKPDKPDKHLVCYFLQYDRHAGKLWLGSHRKSGLWLPAGGHPERNEHPRMAVMRELQEELGQKADFIFTEPIFLTETVTVAQTAGHTDVDLWFLLSGDSTEPIKTAGTDFDREYSDYRWLNFDEILAMPISKLDLHMHRLIHKLTKMQDANLLATN